MLCILLLSDVIISQLTSRRCHQDQDFLDAMNPAGGQFSSLSDMITVTQTLLNANHPKSRISRHSLDRWLQTAHAFEEDDWTEVGLMWEIVKARDSNGRLRKIYWKCEWSPMRACIHSRLGNAD